MLRAGEDNQSQRAETILAQLREVRPALLRSSLLASAAANGVGALVHGSLAREPKASFVIAAISIALLHLGLRQIELSPTWKATLFILPLFGESLFLGVQVGWTPGVVLIALAATVHGALLLGRRAAWLIPVGYGFALVVGGLLIARGTLVAPEASRLNDPLAWLRNAVMFAGITLVIALSLRRMATTLVSSRQAGELALRQVTEQSSHAAQARSSRLETEQVVENAQRLRTVAQLSKGMTHLLKNTLTVVRDAIEQLQTGTSPALVHEAADGVIGAVERAAATTRDLLAFGRRGVPRLEALDLKQHLEALHEPLIECLPESVELRLKLVSNSSIFVEPVRLRQILLNLVLNAGDAIDGPGIVTLSTGAVHLVAAPRGVWLGDFKPGNYVELCVEDNGTGMAPGVAERACEPFYTTKDGSVHDGLGLSVVLGVIRQWGGGLSIESEPGRGTRVSVFLPAEAPIRRNDSSDTGKEEPEPLGKPGGAEPLPTAQEATQSVTGPSLGVEQALRLMSLTALFALLSELMFRGVERPWMIAFLALAAVTCLSTLGMQKLAMDNRLSLATSAVALVALVVLLRQGYMSAGALSALATSVLLTATYGSVSRTGWLLALCALGVLLGAFGPVGGQFDDLSVDPRVSHNWYRLAILIPIILMISTATVCSLLDAQSRSIERLEGILERLAHATRVKEKETASLAVAQRIANQAPKLEAAGRLAGAVAHDLSNALGAILGWAMILREEPTPQQGDIRDAIAAFQQSVTYAEALVLQLEPPVDSGDGQRHSTDLGSLIERSHAVLLKTLRGAVTLKLQLEKDCCVPVSENALRRIIFNLATNACDAMPSGGALQIHCRRLVEQREVLLEVEDGGVGMSEAEQQRVFDAFYTTKAVGRGTGLGLYTVAQLVESSGGTLALESAPGKGTRVSLRWPAVEGVSALTLVPGVEPSSGRGFILLAEDNNWVRRAMTRGLERAGYQVVATIDGTDAKAHLDERDDWYALCTDAVMPGYASARLIDDFAARCPDAAIVVCSGHLPDEVEAVASRCGATLLPKPFSPSELVAALKNTRAN